MISKEPLVSVIVPVYNVEKYICRCIDSLLQQTYENLEIILVDDGSTDLSGAICDEYKKNNPNLQVVHKVNGGLSDARNVGVEKSVGEYISFIDSDDFISPYFYEIMLGCILRDKTAMCVLAHETSFWDGENEDAIELAQSELDFKSYVKKNTQVLEAMFYQKEVTGAQFKIYKRELLEGILFPKGYLYEDLATTYKPIMRCESISVVYSNLYAYRKRNNSIIRREFSEEKLVILQITDQLLEDVRAFDVDLVDAAIVRNFSSNFSVYLQIPKQDTKKRKLVWAYIKKYRGNVLRNKSKYMRRKDKLAAVIAYMGMNVSLYVGKKIGQKGTMHR